MQKMQDLYGAQGFRVVAVDVDKRREDADRFLRLFHPTFEVHFDPNGDLAERFKVQGMPTGVLIDRSGVVRFTHVGFLPVDRVAYEGELRQLLAEK
jgi:thiol-disulfide isomerase/thioredoxin